MTTGYYGENVNSSSQAGESQQSLALGSEPQGRYVPPHERQQLVNPSPRSMPPSKAVGGESGRRGAAPASGPLRAPDRGPAGITRPSGGGKWQGDRGRDYDSGASSRPRGGGSGSSFFNREQRAPRTFGDD